MKKNIFFLIFRYNYDYKIDRNRITWKMLILDDHYEHIAFTDGDDKYFHVSKAILMILKLMDMRILIKL